MKTGKLKPIPTGKLTISEAIMQDITAYTDNSALTTGPYGSQIDGKMPTKSASEGTIAIVPGRPWELPTILTGTASFPGRVV